MVYILQWTLFDLIYNSHQLDDPLFKWNWRERARRAQCDNILSVILQRPHVGVIVISKHDMICWMGRNMLARLKAKQPPKTF